MARTTDGISSLLKRLSAPKVDGLTISNLLDPVNLLTQTQSSSTKSSRTIPAPSDAKPLSFGAKDTPGSANSPAGIQFGRPSSLRTPASASSNQLTSLITQTASGGISSVFGGGLGSIVGIGGLVSGIMNLFGGGSNTLPALVEFQLPQSESDTVYVSSHGSSTYQGTAVEQTSTTASAAETGTYTSSSQANTSTGQTMQYQSSQIAAAVKQALLTSSSLNDVIANI